MNELSTKTFLEETARLKHGIERGFMHLAERLKRIRDERLWTAGYTSFDHFLDEEMKMSETKASRLISIFDVFGQVEHKKLIDAGGWSNLAEVLPAVRKDGDAEKWVEILTNHTRENVRALLSEARTGIEQETCDHDFYAIKICRRCGQREKVYEENTNFVSSPAETQENGNQESPREIVATMQAVNTAHVSQ